MKKIAIVVAVVAFTTGVQAAPKDNTWYIGSKLGWSHFRNTDFYPCDEDIGNNNAIKRDQLGAGAYLGYQHNQYLGFELGYDWFGKMKYFGQSNNSYLKPMGTQLTIRLGYPIADKLDVYTRLGGMVWSADTKTSVANVGGEIISFQEHKIDISPVYSLGFEYSITPNWITRLDYQSIKNISDKDSLFSGANNRMLSIGVVYQFNNKQSAASTIESTTAESIDKNKHFTLRSDVLFEFDKYTLNLVNKAKLNKLYSELISLDPSCGSVMSIGYTDRIGSPSYNKLLSQKRANEVANYLISKGVPANVINSQGNGEENSITGSSCNSIESRAALINCLAPDRRVEIEIQGTATRATRQSS